MVGPSGTLTPHATQLGTWVPGQLPLPMEYRLMLFFPSLPYLWSPLYEYSVLVKDPKVFVPCPLYLSSPLNRRRPTLTFLQFVFIPGHYVSHSRSHPFRFLYCLRFNRVCTSPIFHSNGTMAVFVDLDDDDDYQSHDQWSQKLRSALPESCQPAYSVELKLLVDDETATAQACDFTPVDTRPGDEQVATNKMAAAFTCYP